MTIMELGLEEESKRQLMKIVSRCYIFSDLISKCEQWLNFKVVFLIFSKSLNGCHSFAKEETPLVCSPVRSPFFD